MLILHYVCSVKIVYLYFVYLESIIFCILYHQEKKGVAPMDQAQRLEFEITKLTKILSMVREQPETTK